MNGMYPRLFDSLSLRVLVLTVAFVLVSEAIILIPSIARNYQLILQQRIDEAHLLTLLVPPDAANKTISNPALLNRIDAYKLSVVDDAKTVTIENPDLANIQPEMSVTPTTGLMELARLSLDTLEKPESGVLKITGTATRDPSQTISIVMDEAPVRQELSEFTNRNLQLSVSIAIITSTLVFAVLQFYMVSPLLRIKNSMVAFRIDPENPATAISATTRPDEIGTAQNELSHMQNDLRLALRQKARLAALGNAVAQINHDLRNILATAQLLADRLNSSEDPNVKKLTPRLFSAIDRANLLCTSTLDYVREGAPDIQRSNFGLAALVRDVAQSLTVENNSIVDLQIPESLQIKADRNEMFRVLSNIIRNAKEAGASHITVTSDRKEDTTSIRIADDGPGLKPTARERLFQPFAGSARKGGTGLGLTIARDLMRAHGGNIELVETSEKGTVFRLDLPDNPHLED